jgi:hypothetical protein
VSIRVSCRDRRRVGRFFVVADNLEKGGGHKRWLLLADLTVVDESKKATAGTQCGVRALEFAVLATAIVKNEPASHPLCADETPVVEDHLAFYSERKKFNRSCCC